MASLFTIVVFVYFMFGHNVIVICNVSKNAMLDILQSTPACNV